MIPMWKLKRHPLPMQAHFRHCLVVTYALPAEILQPMLPPGLTLDQYRGMGFVAIALVEVDFMRLRGAPHWMGQRSFLTGYRIFTRFQKSENTNWRGLRILRSETNNRLIQLGGNRLTHYNYHFSRVRSEVTDSDIRIQSSAADGLKLEVCAKIARPAEALPPGSIFPDFQQARRFAGPLPFTFDYEKESQSIVVVRGNRPSWNPMPIEVEVRQSDFLHQRQFARCEPVLSNAFYVKDIDYSWDRGIVYPLVDGHRKP